jgi:zinc protease
LRFEIPWQLLLLLIPGIYVAIRSAQLFIEVAKQGLSRKEKDFYTAFLLNHILGGSDFQSRLYHEVREKRGLTYYSWSGLKSYAAANIWLGGVGTEAAKAQESIDVIKQEIKRLAEQGVTQAELDAARNYVIGSYPFSLDSSMAIAGHIMDLQLEGLPIDYPTSREDLFKAVTLAQANELAKKWLGEPDLLFLSVGKVAPKTEQVEAK